MPTEERKPFLDLGELRAYEYGLRLKKNEFNTVRQRYERWAIQHLIDFAEQIKANCPEESLFCPETSWSGPLEQNAFPGYRIIKDTYYTTAMAVPKSDPGMFFTRVTHCNNGVIRGVIRVKPLDNHDTDGIQALINGIYADYFKDQIPPRIDFKVS